ncbi:MAG TPA: uroporphyrinogen-III synthase [Bryobacteraceae bacterium]|nr:uroporphyrinogen-III synthase [Bryobacteraceae bacterium]
MRLTLSGVSVVVTRAAHQAEELAAPLRNLGADVILLPVIEIAPPADSTQLQDAAARAQEYDWIVFTSANAVAAFAAELQEPLYSRRTRVATIGAATHDVAEQYGFEVSLTPEKFVAESLVAAFGTETLEGRRILIPSAAVTREVVPRELRRRGALVDVVEAYRNVIPSTAQARARTLFQEPLPDWVTFASSSAVEHLLLLTGVETLQNVKIASIGPVTSETVRKHALSVAAEAGEPSTAGLVEALSKYRH